MPAHDPYVGMPGRDALAQRVQQVEVRASLIIVVDSPPGRIEPVDRVQLGCTPHEDAGAAGRLEGAQVLADVALQGEDADRRRSYPLTSRARRGGAARGRPRR